MASSASEVQIHGMPSLRVNVEIRRRLRRHRIGGSAGMGRVDRPPETFFRRQRHAALQLLPLMTLTRQRLAGTPWMQAVKRLGTSGWFICLCAASGSGWLQQPGGAVAAGDLKCGFAFWCHRQPLFPQSCGSKGSAWRVGNECACTMCHRTCTYISLYCSR